MPNDMLSKTVVPAPRGRMHPFVTSPQPAGELPISPIAYRLVAHFALDMPRMPSEESGHVWQLFYCSYCRMILACLFEQIL